MVYGRINIVCEVLMPLLFYVKVFLVALAGGACAAVSYKKLTEKKDGATTS